ncbi:N-acetylneuraminate synthase [Maribellus sediminis]|uniref:N-acetylneuraminate synthase n=1 Tax=Maribellus sediminis TaxID=2696285 RepID=UPI0023FA4217|nr:N-acetylneuraminate synthase [Maribellus sediminis]
MHTIIIAEAGVNHNGDIDLAKKLIEAAADTGVDFIKFQTFKTELLVNKSAKQAEYQKKNLLQKEDSQFAMLKKLELNEAMHFELLKHCEKHKIKFLSTGFDPESIDFLDSLNIPFFKIPSGEITNKPLLQLIAQKGKPIILSTGMATLQEIKDAVNVLTDKGIKKETITILHCNTEYPTPVEDVNLKAMLHIHEELDVKIGYSDHTNGIEIPIAAVALGATVIEKHFTIDKNLPGPDHKASLEPLELKALVQAIRNVEKAISGSGIKEPSPSELKNKPVARKSIIAACAIKKGEIFTSRNLTVKRPGEGISPMLWDQVIGQMAKQDFAPDELIIV